MRFVRQGAKRRSAPDVLTAAEIRVLVDHLALRERTLFLLAASTGLRQSELFGLKWRDVDFQHGELSVVRSIDRLWRCRCKTESSQKPVPLHPLLREALLNWRKKCQFTGSDDWIFASRLHKRRSPYWGSVHSPQVHPAGCRGSQNSEAHRLAYVPTHLLDVASECRS
jgi:integrase